MLYVLLPVLAVLYLVYYMFQREFFLLCTASAFPGDGGLAVIIVLRMVGFAGIILSLSFAQRLYREMKKGKQNRAAKAVQEVPG